MHIYCMHVIFSIQTGGGVGGAERGQRATVYERRHNERDDMEEGGIDTFDNIFWISNNT
jgi:hypothetical protein